MVVTKFAKKYVRALYQLLNVSFRTIASSVGTMEKKSLYSLAVIFDELKEKFKLFTFQNARHNCGVPKINDANQ